MSNKKSIKSEELRGVAGGVVFETEVNFKPAWVACDRLPTGEGDKPEYFKVFDNKDDAVLYDVQKECGSVSRLEGLSEDQKGKIVMG